MSFHQFNFHPNILKAITACGYLKPTPAQQQSIPLILNKKDIIVSAPTGTGKTAAFVLPILQHLTEKPTHKMHQMHQMHQTHQKARVLILAPTRELATQITSVIGKYAKFMQVNVVNLIGGMNYQQQKRKLAQRVDIIVATPGRLMDYMDNHRLDLSQIEILVLDEADRMLDMGFIGDVKKIVSVMKKTRQTLLFSATADDKLMHVLQHLLKNPVRINLTPKENAPDLIKQELYLTHDNKHKNSLLLHFLHNIGIFKAIIFTATKRKAKHLTEQLEDQGFSAAALHGDLKQNARNRTLIQLRENKIRFLVATDVAARGIDVFDITHIINYDLPKFAEDYVHRIGRTGRAGKTGTAITLALPEDIKYLHQIEKFLGQQILRATVAGLEPKEFPTKVHHSAGGGGRGRHRHAHHHDKSTHHGSSANISHNSRKNRFSKGKKGNHAKPGAKDNPHPFQKKRRYGKCKKKAAQSQGQKFES
ncbi:MAG: DEAD/DEAH box helicase [Gammaproteobacteria bacterium]|nr:DEAD/DEAH box helicase [Gammaproteobacteria bacterium]